MPKVQLTAACAYGGANRRDQEWVGKPNLTTDGEGGHMGFIKCVGFRKNSPTVVGPFMSYNWLFLWDYTFYKWGFG